MASTAQHGLIEFAIRHIILIVLNILALFLFSVFFPVYWLVAYTASGLGTRWAISGLSQHRSFTKYLTVLFFYSARMMSYRAMVLYLWFHPEPAAQFPAICMIMAGILFSVSQSTQIRSFSIIQGVGDSATLLIIAADFLFMGLTTTDTIIAGLCALGVMVYHAASLREMQRSRKAAQDLEARNRQSQKMEAVGRLTGGVAHDFNNILTVVMGNLDLYSEVHTEKERQELVSKAHSAAERASVLTSQLLAFSRQSPLQTERVLTDDFVQGLHALAERVLPATIKLQLCSAVSIRDMQVDRNQLEVALLNLIINARDAMPNGGVVQLVAENFDPTKAQNAEGVVGPYVQLDIIDDGEGISSDIVERVFEPFFTTKPVGKGSGLGLSMVKGFAEQSGGELKIKSAPGVGTRVCLLIPAADELSIAS